MEDVLQQNGERFCDMDLASRKAEEASLRRYEAAGWLRKTIGVVGGKDLPAQPSEEDLRLGLRSGIILCNVLNKIRPDAVSKVVEAPSVADVIPDGAALSAYQYFENVRNFLVAIEEMGIPTFEASDLEKGGKSSRIVNCVLALKSYSEWKQGGGQGLWKFGGNLKLYSSGKQFIRRNSEAFLNSFSRNSLSNEKVDRLSSDQFLWGDLGNDFNEMGNRPFHMLVREFLYHKKQEEIPSIVECMLSKVKAEFERRLANNSELGQTAVYNIMMKTTLELMDVSKINNALQNSSSGEIKKENERTLKTEREESSNNKDIHVDESESQVLKQRMLFEQQRRDLQELRITLSTARADMQFLQMKYQEEVKDLGKHLHGLAHAASGYQKVLEENRKLYNQVQDLKGSIRVYCRVRPFLSGQPNRFSTVDHVDGGSMTILTPSKYGKEGRKSFTFNKVFGPSATQEEVFSDTQPLIRSALDGYNVCIFAYGQTGSGKTHTMSGPDHLTQENLGVNYRALSDLFLISEQRKSIISYDISVQMIEIYNEQVRDLLVTDCLNKRLEIRYSSQKGINVPDANLIPVASTSDVINLMKLGHKNRAVSATAMNDRSSRSHSCLTVHAQGRDLTSGTILRGCMHLVDLAGSERVDKSEAVGDRLKEAQHINKSLSALGDVISSLAQKNSHVPYRNSKLTQLLQDSLGGQAKTLMFVHISPEIDAVGETISTLKFAERVSTVELGAARANRESADVKELKEQIASLKEALARREGESSRLMRSKSGSPERLGVMSNGSSPSHPSWQNVGNMSGKGRQSIEDGNKLESRNNSASNPRRESFDLQDLTSWLPVGSPRSEVNECNNTSIGGWVDKVMVNKQDGLIGEENKKQLPTMFYQRCIPDHSKIYPEQPLNNKNYSQDCDVNRNQYELATTDEFDDLEATTSDCSELDFLWQLNVPKVSSIPNGLGSKLKRPSSRQAKGTPEIRSLIPPPPSRRLSNAAVSPLHTAGGRQPVSVDGKRKTGRGK